MSVRELIRARETSLGPLPAQELVARYQRMRAVSRELNHRMTQRLAKDAMTEGGRKLGLLRNGILVFGSEVEMAVLMDYCLYHVRRNGRNSIEQYCCDRPPAPGTDEAICLRVMEAAIHSLFLADSIEPGVGLAVTDLATDEQFLLVDLGLSQTANPGDLFLTRLMLFDAFAATSGAALPMGMMPPGESDTFRADWKKVSTSRNADYDPASLIREFLQKQGASRVRYVDPPSSSARGPQLFPTSRKQRAALRQRTGQDPTRRCPCGSGKMFKNCCLRKPR